MIPHRTLPLLALGLLVAACGPAQRAVTLKADSRLVGGHEAVVKIEAPKGWNQTVNRPGRVAFAFADNFSSLNLAVQPVTAPEDRCSELAERAARDAVKGLTSNPEVKPSFTPGAAGVVDFALTIPASPPGPADKFIQGSAMCRGGALAVATCTVGVNKKDGLGKQCAQVISTMSVETQVAPGQTPAEQAPAQTPAEQAPAQTPAEQAPAQTPAEQAPAQTSAEQAPAQTSAEPAPAQPADPAQPAQTAQPVPTEGAK